MLPVVCGHGVRGTQLPVCPALPSGFAAMAIRLSPRIFNASPVPQMEGHGHFAIAKRPCLYKEKRPQSGGRYASRRGSEPAGSLLLTFFWASSELSSERGSLPIVSTGSRCVLPQATERRP